MSDQPPTSPEQPPSPEPSRPPPDATQAGPPGRGPVELRPLGVGETLDGAIRLYRSDAATFVAIVAVVVVPVSVAMALLAMTEAWILVGIAAVINGFVLTPLLTAAIVKAGADVVLGHDPDLGATYGYAVRRLGPVLLVTVMVGVAVLLGFIALIIPGLILLVRLFFSVTTVVVEDQRGTAALKRSWGLSKGHSWRVFGTLVAAYLLAFAVAAIIGLLFAWSDSPVVVTIGDIVASVLTQPFVALVGVLLYFDLRVRKEGFDLQLLARSIAGEG